MQALMVIALICQIHVGGLLKTISEADAYQAKCQKALIACYEGKFPKPEPSEKEWLGAMKDCIKERKVE